MANYELIVNTKFQPFSYERYIKPYQLYNEAYTEQENALNTLSVTSELLRERALAEKANGQEWAGKYLDYLDSLKAQADTLSKEGLNVNSRRALSNLKTAYGTTVAPVQKAVEAAWNEIWNMDLDRSYVADFEEYLNSDYDNAKIDIYISLK